MIEQSFYFTYVFLITTGTICFIEALRTNNQQVRHVMNIETCISIIAGFFYAQFVKKIETAKEQGLAIDWADINNTRYVDWAISTPFMLLVLCMVLGIENKIPTGFYPFVIVLILDMAMLGSGYAGEVGKLDKGTSNIIGFGAFIALFGYIWFLFMNGKTQTTASLVTFCIFAFFWALYGVVYNLDEEKKIVYYNILDLIAKAFVGIFFWMYFTGVIKW